MPRSEGDPARQYDVLLIGHGDARYGDALASWGDRLAASDCDVTTASPETWYGEELLAALERPRDLVVFYGHGRPGAWVGFARLDGASLAAVAPPRPHRLLLSLNCHAFDAPADGSALATAVLDGRLADRVVGHRGEVRYEANRNCLDRLLAAYRDAVDDDQDGVEAAVDAATGGDSDATTDTTTTTDTDVGTGCTTTNNSSKPTVLRRA